MHLDFMTPEVWNGLVIGAVLVGAAFAVLRLLRDWNRYQWHKRHSDRQASRAENSRHQVAERQGPTDDSRQ